jgi:hypothetical protein
MTWKLVGNSSLRIESLDYFSQFRLRSAAMQNYLL